MWSTRRKTVAVTNILAYHIAALSYDGKKFYKKFPDERLEANQQFYLT